MPLIVGYQTIPVAAGSTTAMGVQFNNVTSETGIPVKSLVTLDVPKGQATAVTTADQIWIYENGAWTKYFYYVKRGAGNIWCKSTEPAVEIGDDVVLMPGQSCFFVRSTGGAGNVTMAGAVVPLASQRSYNVAAGSTTAMAYPWPEPMKIKTFTQYIDIPKGQATAVTTADQIWVYENGAWTKYFYYVKRGAGNIWCRADSPATEVGDDVVIPAGSAFFFIRSTGGAGTITFAR